METVKQAGKLHLIAALGIALLGASPLTGQGQGKNAVSGRVQGQNALTMQSRGEDAGARRGQGEDPAKGDWMGRVEKEIAESEYGITWQSQTSLEGLDAAYQAPNRAHGFRTYFTPEGIRVIPRTEDTPAWEWSLRLSAVGRRGAMIQVEEPGLRVDGNRIEYARGDVTEWYVNDARGLEQGFTLRARPRAREPISDEADPASSGADLPRRGRMPADGGEAASGASLPGNAFTIGGADEAASGVAAAASSDAAAASSDAAAASGMAAAVEVVLELALEGTLSAFPSADGRAIDFKTPHGACAVHYAGLRVTDATGHELPARMERFNEAGIRGIRLVFEDADASYR